MSDLFDDYKERYELRWNEDLAFSQQFMSKIKEILNETTLPKKIQNNVGTESDLKGHDLTISPLQIGVRIRRFSNPETGGSYVKYDDFTEDDKERDTMEDDLYFFGYSHLDESGLHSYIIFDHHDFRKARENKLLRFTRRKNREHGLVWFTCYPIWDIIQHCKIYGKYRRIGWKKRRREYTKPTQPSKTTLTDFLSHIPTYTYERVVSQMKRGSEQQSTAEQELSDLEKELLDAVEYNIGVGEIWPRMFLEDRGMTREEAGLTVRRLAEAGGLRWYGGSWEWRVN